MLNLGGLIDLSSLAFKEAEASKTVEENALTYNRDVKRMLINDRGKNKVYCDINRVCEIEDASVEWLDVTPKQ